MWGNIFLSMASLVICMQLRQIYQQIDARLKRHRNYRRIVAVMDEQYPMATGEQMATANGDASDPVTCAICWEALATARILPCKHLFHKWVLLAD